MYRPSALFCSSSQHSPQKPFSPQPLTSKPLPQPHPSPLPQKPSLRTGRGHSKTSPSSCPSSPWAARDGSRALKASASPQSLGDMVFTCLLGFCLLHTPVRCAKDKCLLRPRGVLSNQHCACSQPRPSSPPAWASTGLLAALPAATPSTPTPADTPLPPQQTARLPTPLRLPAVADLPLQPRFLQPPTLTIQSPHLLGQVTHTHTRVTPALGPFYCLFYLRIKLYPTLHTWVLPLLQISATITCHHPITS